MIRKGLYYFILVALVWYVLVHGQEVTHAFVLALHGNWFYLVLAIILQIFNHYYIGWGYKYAFRAVGVEKRGIDMLAPVLSSLTLNVLAPTMGFGSTALFLDEAQREGTSQIKAVVAPILAVSLDIVTFLIIALIVLGALSTGGALPLGVLIPLVFVAIIGGSLIIGLTIFLRQPELIRSFLQGVAKILNAGRKLVRQPMMGDDWIELYDVRWHEARDALTLTPANIFAIVGSFFLAQLFAFFSLAAVFAAFHLSVFSAVPLVTYVISVLFTIASPTPQGVGIVEGAMSVVMRSYGIAGPVAATVAIVYRLCSFWLPLLSGVLLLQRTRSFVSSLRPLSREWVVKAIAILTAFTGAVSAISAIRPALASHLAIVLSILPIQAAHSARSVAAVLGLSLLLLAFGLWRRKRNAWLLTMTTLILAVISHLIKGFDYDEAILAGLMAILLYVERREFYAVSDEPSYKQAAQIGLFGLLFTIVYSMTGLYLIDWHFADHLGLLSAFHQAFSLTISFTTPTSLPPTRFAQVFIDTVYSVASFSVLLTIASLLRPVLLRGHSSVKERLQATAIVAKYGKTPLAEIALLPDKRYIFPASATCLAYAVSGWSAVVLGDPIGPVREAGQAIKFFKELCHKHDWQPSFYQVRPEYLEEYRVAGFKALKIGHEGYVDVNKFDLEGSERKNLRNSYNKLQRDGYSAEVLEAPQSPATLTRLRQISDEWLARARGREKQFSLGWFEESLLHDQPILVVRDPNNTIVAFANLLTRYNRKEISFDLMRYADEAPSGCMDFLFIELLAWAKTKQYARLSLGLSPLAGVGQERSDPYLEKFLSVFFQHINQFYNFRGLNRYKEKFNPTWEPRYLMYLSAGALTATWTGLFQLGKRKGY